MSRSRPVQPRGLLAGGAALAAVMLGSAGAARAQPVDRYLLDRYFPEGVPGYGAEQGVTVTSRTRPEYESDGVRAGSFIIRPQASESIGYNDNVLGTRQGAGSFVANTEASIGATSDWSRNSLGALLSVDNSQYPSVTSQNQTNWTASLGGTYDIGRDKAVLAGTHISAHESPTDLAAFPFEQPLPFTLDTVHAGYIAQLGRFQVIPGFDYTRIRFSDGTVAGITASQAFRNSDIFQGSVQTRYEFAPLRNAVVEVRGSGTNYVNPIAGQPSRDSNGFAVLAGLDYVVNGALRYRALVGYEARTFSAPYKNHSAPIAEANVIWTPTGLTTVTGRFVHTIEDVSDISTEGYNYTSARVTVDHELYRNILLRGYVGLQRADYVGFNFNQTLYQGGAHATWLLNRNIGLTLSYDITDRQGSKNLPAAATGLVNGGNYVQNLYLLQLRFHL